MINGVNGGGQHASELMNGGDTAQLEQEKKLLENEIARTKQAKLTPEAKKERLEALQKRLKEIEKAIQKAAKKPQSARNEAEAREVNADKKSNTYA